MTGPGPVLGFQTLMPYGVRDILLVSSLYDAFILQRDGQLTEMIMGEFLELNLRNTPGITHVPSGAEAVALARQERRFNLVVSTPSLADMDAAGLVKELRAGGLDTPVVVLGYDAREVSDFLARHPSSGIERAFLWQGDARILLAIVKNVEDGRNLAHDSASVGVKAILVVEDNLRYYSSFLPMIYTEIIQQSHRLIGEGLNLTDKLLRMRARPKILLATTFEEAWAYVSAHSEHLLGIISDIEFPKDGALSPAAGFELTLRARERVPEIPVLLHSSRAEFADRARDVGASFLRKGSTTLLGDLRRFLVEQFAFGDFVFRLPDGEEVGRASDLKELEEQLESVPAASIGYHGERNHFSNWLIARTEFELARRLRPRQVSDFPTLDDLRKDLIHAIAEYRREQRRAVVVDFDRESFDAAASFARIGAGSLGGKARGLAFVRHLLDHFAVTDRFPGVRVSVPPSVVIATDLFDRFLQENALLEVALGPADDETILQRFLEAPLPDDLIQDLVAFLDAIRYPLAVRSSSLLEDSQYLPFTGVYDTFVLPNADPDPAVRLDQLASAIKRVYASTFFGRAKSYLRSTPFRLEEEKMAVILQKLVGMVHGSRFYPDFSGVARSRNFYPTEPSKPEDGIAAICLGMGRTVVEGGKSLTFSPRYPRHIVQFSSIKDILANSQREFWGLELDPAKIDRSPEGIFRESRYDLEAAEHDGTLAAVGSTWSNENQAVYDGLSRPGVRLVSFAPVLKHRAFPLAEVLSTVLEIGERGMSRPVEIEFAARLTGNVAKPKNFSLLQMRPLSMSREHEDVDVESVDPAALVCRSDKVLGNGVLDTLRDAVVVDFHRFDRSRSREAAREVAHFNAVLASESRPYLLIGVGRWGSTDPWLGIPVTWDQISGARAIVETGFRDFRVTPSQGSHFFQNLTSFRIGYFTVNPDFGEGFVDWEWLSAQPHEGETAHVRHLRFADPLIVKMNGRRNLGLIFKPAAGA